MNAIEMKAKIENLADRFQSQEKSLINVTLYGIKKNEQLMGLFRELYTLMQESAFFEVLFNDGFTNSDNIWGFKSRITPWLEHYLEITGTLPSAAVDNKYAPFYRLTKPGYLRCKERCWETTRNYIPNTGKHYQGKNGFVGEFTINPKNKTEQEQFEKAVNDVLNQPQGCALFFITDHTIAEPVFLIKNMNEKKFLLSCSGTIHSFTQTLMQKYNISHTHSTNIPLKHNGDCSAYTQFALAGIINKTAEYGSVFNTLLAVNNGHLDLNSALVTLETVAPNQRGDSKRPSETTIMRLLSLVASTASIYPGWISFCKNKNIHPKYCIMGFAPYESSIDDRLMGWGIIPSQGSEQQAPKSFKDVEGPSKLYSLVNFYAKTEAAGNIDKYTAIWSPWVNTCYREILLFRNLFVNEKRLPTKDQVINFKIKLKLLTLESNKKNKDIWNKQILLKGSNKINVLDKMIKYGDSIDFAEWIKNLIAAEENELSNANSLQTNEVSPLMSDPQPELESKIPPELVQNATPELTKLNNLYKAIDAMAAYGQTLVKNHPKKGNMIINHAKELTTSLNTFIKKHQTKPLTPDIENSFKKEFSQLLHKKDSQMSEHRKAWKIIVVNIFIALTGVGFIALIAKAAHASHVAHTTHKEKKHYSVMNNTLFFGKTHSEKLVKEVDKQVDKEFSPISTANNKKST